MLLHRFYDEDLAQASYLIGCQAENTAIVVDPRRDITDYLHFASQYGMDIVGVTETHIHADYLSGTRELAAATGAQIYVSGAGGTDWQYEFDGTRLQDRDTITIGNIILEARHTPGHTPEHLSFLITDGAFANTPGYMLSGDFVFSGDLGRPDLLDEAAGGVRQNYAGCRSGLYQSAQVQPWPVRRPVQRKDDSESGRRRLDHRSALSNEGAARAAASSFQSQPC